MNSEAASPSSARRSPPNSSPPIVRRMLQSYFRQFGNPTGVLGRVALGAMARRNAAVNEWVLDSLGVGPGDRFLDVGCGPGVALAAAAKRGATVSGADVSPLAVAAARRRTGAGRVEVASAEALPFGNGEFTVVVTVNALGHWSDAEAGARELLRVTAPGGRVAVAMRMRVEGLRSTDRRTYGATPDQVRLVDNLLRHVGFASTVPVAGTPGDEATAVIVATKPVVRQP